MFSCIAASLFNKLSCLLTLTAPCWTSEANKQVLGGRHQTVTGSGHLRRLAECKQACMQNVGCTGLDYDYKDNTCWLHGRWSMSSTNDKPRVTHYWYHCRSRRKAEIKRKGKVFPYSLPSVGPEADPGVQAVSRQVT